MEIKTGIVRKKQEVSKGSAVEGSQGININLLSGVIVSVIVLVILFFSSRFFLLR